jgi:hypothetical protein
MALRRAIVVTLAAVLGAAASSAIALCVSAGVAAAVPLATLSTPTTGGVALDPMKDGGKILP